MSSNINRTNNEISFINYSFNKDDNDEIKSNIKKDGKDIITISNSIEVKKVEKIPNVRNSGPGIDHVAYSRLSEALGLPYKLIPSIVSYSNTSTTYRQLKSLTLDDFEKIKHAFHKYLPSYHDLDKIDFASLNVLKHRGIVRYEISDEMRKIIKAGADTIIANESDLSNNKKSQNESKYQTFGERWGLHKRILPCILNYPSTDSRQLKSLTPYDFEKIKQAFHKYLPSYRALDKIDLASLNELKLRGIVRYEISDDMREIIRFGVDSIIDNESAKKSQEDSSRKTKQEAVETLTIPSTAPNKNPDKNEPQLKKAKTMPSATDQQPFSIQEESIALKYDFYDLPENQFSFLEEVIAPWRGNN